MNSPRSCPFLTSTVVEFLGSVPHAVTSLQEEPTVAGTIHRNNILSVPSVQPLNCVVHAPHPAHGTILCAARTDSLIRVQVPRNVTGLPCTRPRGNRPGPQGRYPRNAFPGGSFVLAVRDWEPGRTDRSCTQVCPMGCMGQDLSGSTDHDFRQHGRQ